MSIIRYTKDNLKKIWDVSDSKFRRKMEAILSDPEFCKEFPRSLNKYDRIIPTKIFIYLCEQELTREQTFSRMIDLFQITNQIEKDKLKRLLEIENHISSSESLNNFGIKKPFR